MELRTHLGQDRFGWMNAELTRSDVASMLVEVEAPPAEARSDVAPTNLVVVLDRSGSMGGGRLDQARRALSDVVDRLSPYDTFGLVTFDDRVDVVVPAGPVTDRDAIKRAIDDVHPRGSTDLGAGLLRGLQEARRLEATSGVRVLLVSDGHANSGVVDPDVLGGHVGTFVEHRITTSTLGMGLGYDEVLLSAVARRGGGNEHFAQEADTASGIIADECGELLGQRFLSCRLTVTVASGMDEMEVLNEATSAPLADGVQIELGGFQPEQVRTLVLQFRPKQATRPGRRKVAMLRLDYLLADDLSEHHVSTSVWTHVTRPGDKPPVVDRDVMAEVLFQRVQRRKRRGMQALSRGDLDGAVEALESVVRLVKRSRSDIPKDRWPEFDAEIASVEQHLEMIARNTHESRASTSRLLSAQVSRSSRMRDRGNP